MVSVKHNVNWSLLQPQRCHLLLNDTFVLLCCLQLLKAPLGIRCRRRSTRTCLFPRMVATAGRGHCGVLTITAYWTLVASLWLWRLSEKDKSRLSSTTFSDQWGDTGSGGVIKPAKWKASFVLLEKRGEGNWMNHPSGISYGIIGASNLFKQPRHLI